MPSALFPYQYWLGFVDQSSTQVKQADQGKELLTKSLPSRVRVRGWAVRGDNTASIVQLDDGRRVTNEDSEYGGIARRGNAVWIGGDKLYLVEPRIPDKSPEKGIEQPANSPPAPPYIGEAVIPTPESVVASERTSVSSLRENGASGAGRSAAPTPSPSLVQRADNRDNIPAGSGRVQTQTVRAR